MDESSEPYYRVSYYMNDRYAVYLVDESDEEFYEENGYNKQELVFDGDLADCEAYIRLHKEGYMT